MSFYCEEAKELIKEAIRTRDSPFIPGYREDLIRNSILELDQFKSSKAVSINGKSEESVKLESICIERTKRCVLAYQRNRLDRYIDLLWLHGATTSTQIPRESQLSASRDESIFIKGYQKLVTDWKGEWLDLDFSTGCVDPPTDVFVEIMSEGGAIQLIAGTQHYLRRSDIDDLIISGHLQIF